LPLIAIHSQHSSQESENTKLLQCFHSLSIEDKGPGITGQGPEWTALSHPQSLASSPRALLGRLSVSLSFLRMTHFVQLRLLLESFPSHTQSSFLPSQVSDQSNFHSQVYCGHSLIIC
jgi:hypothetical protein